MQKSANSTLKLIFPQWQGGEIAAWFEDLKPEIAAKGYVLGAWVLDLLVNSINKNLAQNEAQVPVSLNFETDKSGKRLVQEGIIDKKVLQRQNLEALRILNERKPRRVLTLGGECAVSIAPFTYLAAIYDDLAMLWLDSHPDLGLPNDEFYKGYHAMAVSAIAGKGTLREDFSLPSHLAAEKILLVGLNSHEAEVMAARQAEFGIQSLTPRDAKPENIISWLKKVGAKRVLMHLDLDVIDAKELYIAVGNTGAMSVAQISGIFKAVAAEFDVVGLTIAEHFPKPQLVLKGLLEDLPLIKGDK